MTYSNGKTTIKADFNQEMLEDLKASSGIDVVAEMSKILSEEINKSILHNIARNGFDKKESEVKALNREGQIDSILEDKTFMPINIEETPEYKWLSDEDKEKYQKYGRVISGAQESKL